MPVAPALPAVGALLAALALLALYFAARSLAQLLRDVHLPSIPVVGGAIRSALDAIADWFEDRIAALGRAAQRLPAHVIFALGSLVGLAARNLGAYAYAVEQALDDLATRRIPGAVRVADQALRREIAAIRSVANAARAGVAELRRELPGRLRSLRAEIAADLVQPLRRELGALRHSVDVLADRVTRRIARPLEHVIDVELPRLRGRVTDLERELRAIPLRHILAGVAAGTTALALVRALGLSDTAQATRCGRKLRGMCELDPTVWDDLLEGLTELAVAWSLIDLVRQAQDLARPISRAMDEIARM